jgi:hypothetical protein
VSGESGDSGVGKEAIVRVFDDAGELEYIGWYCTEEPEATFRMELLIPLTRWERFGSRCKARVIVPAYFYQSVIARTIEPVHVLPIGGHGMATARMLPAIKQARIEVDVARVPFITEQPGAALVSIKARRAGMPKMWKKHTEAEYEQNRKFWGGAHPGGGRHYA